MYYTYILQSQKDHDKYVGYTSDLRKRLREHNAGSTESTKNRAPFTLVYYEAHQSKEVATEREKYLKSGWGKEFIKNKLKIS